ncbi:RVT_3 domain-containing protein/zf-RVT domain-containing protein, partial [Cephalotus follicularis]
WIWKMTWLQNYKYFVWLVMQNKLLTNEMLLKRQLIDSAHCRRCMAPYEDCLHILRDCNEAKKFLATLWILWCTRNAWTFEGLIREILDVQKTIKGYTNILELAFEESDNNSKKEPQTVSWLRSPISLYKLNTDGFSRGNLGPSGVGGVIRDVVGNWGRGFSKLWALREGLKLAWNMHIKKLIMETDSHLSIKLIQMADTTFHPPGGLIEDCRYFLSKAWNCSIKHIYRDSNKYAD